jgi:hypothetical protein
MEYSPIVHSTVRAKERVVIGLKLYMGWYRRYWQRFLMLQLKMEDRKIRLMLKTTELVMI